MVMVIGRSGFAGSRGRGLGESASGTMIMVRLASGLLAGHVVPFSPGELLAVGTEEENR